MLTGRDGQLPAGSHDWVQEPLAFMWCRYAHHLCEVGNCLESYVAFESLDELQQHQRMVHSSSMPRWDQSRARVVPLSELFVASPEQQQR